MEKQNQAAPPAQNVSIHKRNDELIGRAACVHLYKVANNNG
jgi:hypothetical protein